MVHPMTVEEQIAFLDSTPPHTGKLATVRADGRPHVAPIWFVLDRAAATADNPVGDLLFNTDTTSVKGRNLARDPRVALCIDLEQPPFSFLIVEGTVTLVDDLDEVRRWATAIGGRYMGADRAEQYGARNGVPGELLVRLVPTKIVAVADLAD